MGSASSKGGAAAGRAARTVAKAAVPGKSGPSGGSHLPADDDLLTNFKPSKGERFHKLCAVTARVNIPTYESMRPPLTQIGFYV